MEGCRVEVREGRGRCLVAGRSFRPGDVTLAQLPYDAVLYDDQLAVRCHQTFENSPALLRCGHCKFAMYSSREAQRASWPAHRPECKALQAMAPRRPPPSVRLAARVFWKHARQEAEGAAAAPWASFADVEGLQTHWDVLPDERKETFAQMAYLTRQYMSAGSTGFSGERDSVGGITEGIEASEGGVSVKQIARMLARFACNNHTICDEELRPIGAGIYPLAAMADHSCTPNASQSFEAQGRINFRALRHIAPGEEVTISYIELAATRPERREALLSSYFFDIDEGREHRGWEALDCKRAGLELVTAARPPNLDAKDVALTTILRLAGGRQVKDSGLLIRSSSPAPLAASSFPLEEELAATAATDISEQPRFRVECWGPEFDPGGSVRDPRALSQLAEQLQILARHFAAAEAARKTGQWRAVLREAAAAVYAADGRREAALKLADMGDESREAGLKLADVGKVSRQALDPDFNVLHPQGAVSMGVMGGGRLDCKELKESMLAGGVRGLNGEEQREGVSGEGVMDADDHAGGVEGARKLSGRGLEAGLKLGPSHVTRMRLAELALQAAIEAGDSWHIALEAARHLAHMYKMVYPPIWPALGLHYAALAKLEDYVGSGELARAAAASSVRILQITHPAASDALRGMKHLLAALSQPLDPDPDSEAM